jgi:hypothetical protein
MSLVLLICLNVVSSVTLEKKTQLHEGDLTMQTIEANIPQTKTGNCPLCDEPLQNPNECGKCDWVTGYGEHAPEAGLIKPRDLAAAFLSLMVPGLGHVYKGQTKMGVMFLLGAVLASFCALIFLGFIFPLPASPIILALYWGLVVFHAYWAEDLSPRPEEIWSRMVAMAMAGLMGATLTVFAAVRFLHSVG